MEQGSAQPGPNERLLSKTPSANHRRELIGVITSDNMNKTRVVMVERRVAHQKYGKYLTKRNRYKAHDDRNEYRTGDRVLIVESRPLSRDKRWRIEKLIERPEEV